MSHSSSTSSLIAPSLDDDRGSSVSSSLKDEYEALVSTVVAATKQSSKADSQLYINEKSQQLPLMNYFNTTNQGIKVEENIENHCTDTPRKLKSVKMQLDRDYSDFDQPNNNSARGRTHSPESGRDVISMPWTVSGDVSLTEVTPRRVFQCSTGYGNYNSNALVEDPMSTTEETKRLENIIDSWSVELKTNILSEYQQAKCRLVNKSKVFIDQEKNKVSGNVNQLMQQIGTLQGIVQNYETLLKEKDATIASLQRDTDRTKKQKTAVKTLADWRVVKETKRAKEVKEKVADKFHKSALQKKAFNALKGNLEKTWRERVKDSCDSKAQAVCRDLVQEYEDRIQQLNQELDAMRQKLEYEKELRKCAADSMKKALMRGVCALNVETMGVFGQDVSPEMAAASQHPDSIPRQPVPSNFLDASFPPELLRFLAESSTGGSPSVVSSVQEQPSPANVNVRIPKSDSRERWLTDQHYEQWAREQASQAQFAHENGVRWNGLSRPEPSMSSTPVTTAVSTNIDPETGSNKAKRMKDRPSSTKNNHNCTEQSSDEMLPLYKPPQNNATQSVVRGDFLQSLLNSANELKYGKDTPINESAHPATNHSNFSQYKTISGANGNVSTFFHTIPLSTANSAARRNLLRSSTTAQMDSSRGTPNSAEFPSTLASGASSVASLSSKNTSLTNVTANKSSVRVGSIQAGTPTGVVSQSSVASILVEKHQPINRRTVAPVVLRKREEEQQLNGGPSSGSPYDIRHGVAAFRRTDAPGTIPNSL